MNRLIASMNISPALRKFLYASAFLACATASQAAVTVIAEYHLGEAGSLGTNSRPNDSVGSYHYTANNYAGSTPTATAGVYAIGSTTYLDTSNTANNEGFSGPTFTLPGTDNFGFGIYVRAAANTATTQGNIFTLGPDTNGALKIGLTGGGWSASLHGVAWIGTVNGTGFTADQWVHLAIIRASGVSTFYINGTAQSGTSAGTPTIGSSNLSVNTGGAAAFDGHLDEARVVTFTAGESTTNILNAIQVPEPSAALLSGLGAFFALLRRRRR